MRTCVAKQQICVFSVGSLKEKPKGSQAVFTFSCFLLDLCLSMVCLHLLLEYVSVEDAARKFHEGRRLPAGIVLLLCTVGCSYLKWDCNAPQSVLVLLFDYNRRSNPSACENLAYSGAIILSLPEGHWLFFPNLMSEPFGSDMCLYSA